MVAGVLLFAVVAHFVLMPAMANPGLPTVVVRVLLGLSLCACAVSLLLRRRVPQRSTDESADLFWTTAASPALLAWAPLEIAILLAIIAYAGSGSLLAIAVAAVPTFLFILLNPAYLERR